jgi:hypothetical protein
VLNALHGDFRLDALQLTAEERARLSDVFAYHQTEQDEPEG